MQHNIPQFSTSKGFVIQDHYLTAAEDFDRLRPILDSAGIPITEDWVLSLDDLTAQTIGGVDASLRALQRQGALGLLWVNCESRGRCVNCYDTVSCAE